MSHRSCQRARHQRIRPEPVEVPPVPADAHHEIHELREEHGSEDHRAGPVYDRRHFRSAERIHDHRRPGGVGVQHRHSRQRQDHEAQREGQVRGPPDRREALIVLALDLRQLAREHVRAALALLALLVFAVEPQRRVRPEEREGAGEQPDHEFRGGPDIGIALEIVGRAVRLEGRESPRRVLVALLAGLDAVAREHARFRIVDALDGVAAMAVEALGRVGEAQRVDLAVIGLGIGLEAFGVTVAAVLGDDELGLVPRRILDVVGRMAIGADGRIRVAVLQHRLAVHRGRIQLALLHVALAAGVRQVQAPLLAALAVLRIDVVRVVAVVAGGVGARLVGHARPRVDRLHVPVDHLHDDAQPGVLLGLVVLLGGIPECLVALNATDLVLHSRLVRDLGDVPVALDAKALRVNAFPELLLIDEQLAHLPVAAGRGESRVAVAAQADLVLDLRRRRLGFLASGRRSGVGLFRLRGSGARRPCRRCARQAGCHHPYCKLHGL